MTDAKKHVALVCPGGPVTRDLADKVVEIAAAHCGEQGQLHFHDQCFLTAGHFAGNDDERSAAFLDVANDPKYDAVWFARGGYGACRLNETLFDKLNDRARRKTYLGYSDAGMILARLYKDGIGKPVHGPMPTDMARKDGEYAIGRALDYLIQSDTNTLEKTIASGNKTVAFNITVLSHMIDTDWAPDLAGHIVMLEDVSEYLYSIDRSMFTIMSSSKMKKAAGVRLGRISDVPENDRPFGQTAEEIVQDWCERSNVPYLGRADIGHDADNKVVPFGAWPVRQSSA
ncbi:MAG: LD-carboxypeptidase [Pseudomonadota bacterium]